MSRLFFALELRARVTRPRLVSLAALALFFAALCLVASRLALEIVPALVLAAISLLDFTPGRAVALRLAERRYKRLSRSRSTIRVLLPLSARHARALIARLGSLALAMRPPPVAVA